jgi:ribonuclease HII
MKSSLLQFDLQHNCPLIGVDEVGRGALAGPVYAGAVHFKNLNHLNQAWLAQVNDSKKVSCVRRRVLAQQLKEICVYSLGSASCTEINQLGILPATLLAMKRAVNSVTGQTGAQNYLVLVDGISKIKNLEHKQQTVKKGDSTSLHIAAASIIAKTARDEFMAKLSNLHTGFGWERNMGYGTAFHIQALLKHGTTKEHRLKFVRKILGQI